MSYYNMYNMRMNIYCQDKDIPFNPLQQTIILKKMSDKLLGVCKSNLLTRYEINLNKTYWDAMSEEDRMILFSHESSHCRLWIEHNNDPAHYMYEAKTYIPFTDFEFQLKEDIMKRCKNGNKHLNVFNLYSRQL